MRALGRLFAVSVMGMLAAPALAQQADPAVLSYEKTVSPLLQKYCYQCHGNGANKADFAIDTFKSIAEIRKDRARWDVAARYVRTSEMPPPESKAQPTQEEREIINNWITKELFRSDPNNPDPGRITIRRLNRAEYSNTIRDLLGVNYQASADFPPDDSGYGFDNIGDVLSLPPVLLEKYLTAADKILDEAIPTDAVTSKVQKFPASLAEVGFNAIGDRGDGWVHLISLEEDDVGVTVPVTPGDYTVRVQAFARGSGGSMVGGGNNSQNATSGPVDPMRLSIMVDNAFITEFPVTATEDAPGWYEAKISMPQGRHRVRAIVRRVRGGENELTMTNGRIGKQQSGIIFVKQMELTGPLPVATRRYPAAELDATGGQIVSGGARKFDENGETSLGYNVSKEGEFILRAQAYADQAGPELTKMELRVDGKPVRTFEVSAPATMIPFGRQRVFSVTLLVPQPFVYETKVKLAPGPHKISAAFVNDFQDPANDNPNLRNRNLYVDFIEIAQPGEPALQPEMPALVKQLLPATSNPQTKAAEARKILTTFARRAWRRPVEPAELDKLMVLFNMADQHGDPFNAAIKLPMKAVLVSPNFLFRGEIHPDPNNPKSVHPVGEFDLATRLSYFLWSSTPDDELLALAEKNELRKNLDTQIRRMIASPRSAALVENFSSQWLQTRGLDTVAPDKEMFPAFDAGLKFAMQQETQRFFEYILRENRSVIDFLNADYTFVNGRLAEFYGIPNVTGEEFRKVSLTGLPRRGVITQGSVLVLTSNPSRTSPVKRGKFVLDNLLGTPPPEPPPDVPSLDDEKRKLTGSLRQQMKQHQENPNCSSCHARMDPIGFGLENFNAIGVWRDKDGEAAVDASGQLVSGESFNGAMELANVLATQKRADFLRCLSEKMLTYALGRGTEYYDAPAVEKIVKGMENSEFRFSSLIKGVVDSVPFQMRRGEGTATASR